MDQKESEKNDTSNFGENNISQNERNFECDVCDFETYNIAKYRIHIETKGLNNNDEHGLPKKQLHQKINTLKEEQKTDDWVFSKMDKMTSSAVPAFELCQSILDELFNKIPLLS